MSRKPQEFGKGSIEGVAAAESAANAVCPAALIPMLAFGIPGDTVTAVLLGEFLALYLNPGHVLFEQLREILYGLFAVLIATNVMLLFLGKVAIRYLRNIASIPNGLLMPVVTVLCFAGAFAINSSYFDLLIAFGGGVLGYAMRKTDVPVPPLVIALLLAPMLEQNLRQSLMFSDGSLAIFSTRPIAATFLAITLLSVAGIAWQAFRSRRPQPQE
jgi:putative tricarboxylic transport membrane protein